MQKFLKWFFRFIVMGGIVFLILLFIAYLIVKRSIPDYQYDEAVISNGYSAEILRDLHAIPHIYAEDEAGLLFALGFAHAQDRLWQMDIARRTAQGRLSELFGEQTLDMDIFFRALDLWKLAQRASKTLPSEDLALLKAYADGVNAYILDINQNKRGTGAPEFLIFGREISPWTPADSLSIIKLMALELSSAASNEILHAKLGSVLTPQDMRDIFYDLKLPPEFDQLEYTTTNPAQSSETPLSQSLNPIKPTGFAGASNAFAVASSRSANQTAILGNDPHLKLTAPTIWMLAHLNNNSTGDNVFGGSIPGIPLILIGHNQNLAWGLTTSNLDDQDLIVLRRIEDGYQEDQSVIPFKSERVEIIVKDKDEPVYFTREQSEYGPVIPTGGPLKVEEILSDDQAIALSWTALAENDHSIISGFRMMRASNVHEAMQALEHHIAPSQIFTLADKEGNIAQIAAGRLPLRSEANLSNGISPMPNWLGDAGFTGTIPFSQNPKLIQPDDGFLIHTNNKFIEAPYPYHFSYSWGDVYRYIRSEELLEKRKFHSLESLKEAQNDDISAATRVLLPLIAREFWFQPNRDESKSKVLELLANWNGEFDAFLPEPLIYSAWIEELDALIFSDELGQYYKDLGRVDPLRIERVFRNVDGAARWCDIRPTPQTEICADISEHALDRALEKLQDKYGSNIEDWRWGRAHHAVHKNQFLSEIPIIGGLSNIVQEQSGDSQTLLRLAFPGGLDYDFDSNHGAGLRMVVDFSDLNRSQIIIATGQSGHVLSPHYDDLSTLWRAGEYLPMNTDPQFIEGNLKGRIRFIPSPQPGSDTE